MKKLIFLLLICAFCANQRLNAQITINNDLVVTSQRSVDGKQYKISTGNKHIPYASSAEFLSMIPNTRRHIGQIAYIANGSEVDVWHFVGGIADSNFRSTAEIDPTVSPIIKALPVTADATTNKYYYWNNGSIGRKQISYSDITGTPSGTLQTVTDAGNSTTNNIHVSNSSGIHVSDPVLFPNAFMYANEMGIFDIYSTSLLTYDLKFGNSGFYKYLRPVSAPLTLTNTNYLPTTGGTLLTSVNGVAAGTNGDVAVTNITGNAGTVTNGVYTSRSLVTTAPLLGGGDLSANRTLSIDTGKSVGKIATFSDIQTLYPAGSDGYIQYKTGSVLNASSNLVFTSPNRLDIGTMQVTFNAPGVAMSFTNNSTGHPQTNISNIISSAGGLRVGGINNIAAWAALDVVSSTRGVLLPRMTTTAVNAIATPGRGLIVYDSTINKFKFFSDYWRIIPDTTGGGAPSYSTDVDDLLSATDFADARNKLSLEPGTDVQAFNSTLATIAGLTTTANYIMQSSGGTLAMRSPTQVKLTFPSFVDSTRYINRDSLVEYRSDGTTYSTRFARDTTTLLGDVTGIGDDTIQTTLAAVIAGNHSFTGTTTLASPFTLGATSVTTTGTQLNYLSTAAGTTGTNTSNIVYSTAPTFTTSIQVAKIKGGASTTSDLKLYATGGTAISGAEIQFASGVDGATQHAVMDYVGRWGMGSVTSPTAWLHLGAAAGANFAPLKFTTSTLLPTPEAGAVEFDGTHFYGTVGSTRYQFDQQTTANLTVGTTTITGGVSGNGLYNNAGVVGEYTRPVVTDAAEQVMSSTVTWTGTTAPSGTQAHNYQWSQQGKLVTVRVNLNYTVAGAAVTQATFPFPGDLPTPKQPTGWTSTSDIIYYGAGNFGTVKTSLGNLRSFAGVQWDGTVYQFVIRAETSAAYRYGWLTVQYFIP